MNPYKMTPEVKAKLLHAARLGMALEHAAPYAGITYRTLKRWRDAGEDSPEGSALAELKDEFDQAFAEGGVIHYNRVNDASRGYSVNASGEKVPFEGQFEASKWSIEHRYGKPSAKFDVTSGGKALPAATLFVVGRDVVDRVDSEDARKPEQDMTDEG